MPGIQVFGAPSKSTMRSTTARFIARWRGTTSEAGDKQLFWAELLGIFGVDTKELGYFELYASRLSTGGHGFIDFLYPGELAVEHKSAGGDLEKALDQLLDYMPSVPRSMKPRLLVTCNFDEFLWHDLVTRQRGRFNLVDLASNLDVFWWLAGYRRPDEAFEDEEDANLAATALMAKLHDGVLAANYAPHHLRVWLTRILFCLFADDTEVWDRNAFAHYLHLRTTQDGMDLGPQVGQLFQILNTAPENRSSNLDEDLASFTYINGDLFAEDLPTPFCTEDIRDVLLQACRFDWSAISPAIFGSMFQNVMTPAERRELGAHYTTEANILKTIKPLFLDDLAAELDTAKTRPALLRFHQKLGELRFLDPACGCGNFLVIAYRELRRLETETLRKLADKEGRTGFRSIDLSLVYTVSVDQFYGIEIEEFPARIAQTALYLMDHKCNREVSAEFGQHFARFPIPASPHIVIDNALRMDWSSVLRSEQTIFVFGNPPFVGRQHRSEEQTEDQKISLGADYNGYLDYATSWFFHAAEFMDRANGKFAFVATNSICQGEQVAPMWEPLLRRGFHIDFAYRTFPWKSEAKGEAAVHVVIVGVSQSESTGRRLFYSPLEGGADVKCSNINPYLVAASDVIVRPQRSPIFTDLPRMAKGSKPTDGQWLLVEADDVAKVRKDPIARKYLRPVAGARVMLHDEKRYCLWLHGVTPQEIRSSPVLSARVRGVQAFRRESRNQRTRQLAHRPTEFDVDAQPTVRYLCAPAHSSMNRRTIPMRFYEPDTIVLDSALSIAGADDWLFALLQSTAFTLWVAAVGGRLKSDYRIAPDLVYNSFPIPDLSEAAIEKLNTSATEVFAARDDYPNSTLADLYDAAAMPSALAKAHDRLDKVVGSLFAPRRRNLADADLLAVMFARYEALSAPLFGKQN